MASRGMILDIRRGSFHDGPGMRTTVFLKGCPLRCAWCHNPASLSFKSEKRRRKVPGCGIIEETAGRVIDVQEIFEMILRDRHWYESTGGGLTLSGGEPLAQKDFTGELLSLVKEEGIHCCLETSTAVNQDAIKACLPLTDLWLIDWKLSRAEELEKWCGASMEKIKTNLQFILDSGGQVVLRLPLIPGINDNSHHWDTVAAWAQHENVRSLEIMAYHPWGRLLWEEVGRPLPPDFPVPSKEMIEGWENSLANRLPPGKLIRKPSRGF